MVQDGDLYKEANKQSSKYRDIAAILDEHKDLLRWSKDEVVLDAGCGPGDVTHNVLLPRIPDDACKYMVGVDISPTMKEYGFKNFPHPKLIFETLDLSTKNLDVLRNDPRLKDGFDKIFSFYALHWIPYIKSALNNIFTLLKPGGQALLVHPTFWNCQKTLVYVQKNQPWADKLQDFSCQMSPHFFSDNAAEDFATLLKETGFKIVVCKSEEHEEEYENIETPKNLMASLDLKIKIPKEFKDKFIQECMESMLANKIVRQAEDGKAYLKINRLTAFIEK